MHIVITGASSGIGRALAVELAKEPGARLSLVARRVELLNQLAGELGVPVHVIAKDLARDEDPADFLAEAERAHGPVDVLINNAGVQVVGETASIDVAAGEASLKLNLATPLALIRRVLPSMLLAKRGHIVNIASMAALAPTPGMTYYNASKAGLAAASEALRGELRKSGVSVTTVYPGIIFDTSMASSAIAKYESTALVRMQPTATAADLAIAVRRAMKRRNARLVFPRVYGITRWFPAVVRWFMDRFSPRLVEA